MPTITPTGRATVGASPDEYRLPRSSVTAATGMGLPSLKQVNPPVAEGGAEKTGQPDTKEETTAPAVTLSPQLTALARKQQKLQQEIQAQREKEQEWAKKEADYVPKSTFKAKLQENAAEALKDLGTDYDELTRLLLEQQNGADPVKALEAKIQKLESSQEETVNKQYEATIKQYKKETSDLVAKDPKKFFLIAKEGAEEAVVQHIVDTWEENPDTVLTVEEAASEIEEFLREEAKKKKALLEELEGPPPQKTEEKKLPPPRTSSVRTLTEQVESAPTRTYNQFQHLSMKERIAQAIARAQK
jgi:hypothetical protein